MSDRSRTRPRRHIERLEPRLLRAVFAFDPTFGNAGTIDNPLRDPVSAFYDVSFVAAQSDGTVLAGGFVTGGARLVRYTADGKLDTTYNGDGLSESVPALLDVAAGVQQPDGKVILVFGEDPGYGTGRFLYATRLTAGGDIDTTFGTDGVVTIALGTADVPGTLFSRFDVHDVAVTSDGKIVIAASTGNETDDTERTGTWAADLVRLNANGSPDTTFGSAGNGTVETHLFTGTLANTNSEDPGPNAVVLDSADRIYVTGSLSDQLFVARYTTAGALDSKFGGDGIREFTYQADTSNGVGKADDLLVQPGDGKIVVGGYRTSEALARFNPDGSFDTTFGQNHSGIASIAATGGSGISSLLRDSVGRYVGASHDGLQVARFTPDGQPDTTFGPGGVVSANPTSTSLFDGATAADLDGQDRILLAGPAAGARSYLARVTGRPDVQLADNGTLIVTGAAGNNTISFAASGSNIVVNRNGVATSFPATNVKRIDVLTQDGDDVITFTIDTTARVDTGNGSNTVTLNNGDATLFVAGTGNVLTAGDGTVVINATDAHSTTITVGNGNDTISGGDNGPDSITTGNGNNNINAYGGNDTIVTGSGNDNILGDNGDDSINSGAGNDTIDGGTGADTINAGPGNDLAFAGDPSTDEGSQVLIGGDGNDALYGTAGRDSLYGNAGKDALIGYAGSDLLSGGGGKDKIAGLGGPDRIYGGPGDDQLDGGNASDRIFAGSGNDKLFAGPGNDLLHGDAGDDLFFASDTSSAPDIDTLDGGAGTNTAVQFDPLDQLLNATAG